MNPLLKKSVLFVGDSLCEGYCERETEYADRMGYAGRIMVKNEMTGLNRSLGGASMGNCRGENLVYKQLVDMTGNSYEYGRLIRYTGEDGIQTQSSPKRIYANAVSLTNANGQTVRRSTTC